MTKFTSYISTIIGAIIFCSSLYIMFPLSILGLLVTITGIIINAIKLKDLKKFLKTLLIHILIFIGISALNWVFIVFILF